MEPALAPEGLRTARASALGGRLARAGLPLFFCCGALLAAAGCGRGPAPKLLKPLACAPQPLALALDGDAERLAVACSRTSEVLVFELGSPGKAPLRLATRPHPCALLFSPDGQRLVVAEECGPAASLAVFKMPDGRFARRVPCLAHPRSMAWAEDRAKLYLCAGDEGVAVLRAGDFRLEKVIKAGGRAQQLCLQPASAWAYLSSQQADSLACVKLADRSLHAAVQTAPLPRGLALSPDGAFAWVACEGLEPAVAAGDEGATLPAQAAGPAQPAGADWGELSVVRLQDLVATDRLPAAGGALALAFSKSGRSVFSVSGRTGFFDAYDSLSHARLKRLFLGRLPSALAYDARRGLCYVALHDAAAVAVVDVSAFP